ncbi:MAG TPA: helix-turn-helix domain-containing protein [Aggregatilineaceae bacterium]|nr:helix-turn-helix domain-containing protein [Aggregatilineaceae bacterium]
MLLSRIWRQVVEILQPLVKQVEVRVKAWMKPGKENLVGGTVADLVKSKPELIAENAFLRQQLILFKRQVKPPKLTSKDRGLLVTLASRVRDWKNALLIVKPDTLLKWHRQGFKLFWRQKSKGEARQPRISEAIIALIKQMAVENRRWGTKRIRGELLKLGLTVNRGTIRHYMWRARRNVPPVLVTSHFLY